jgi:hypothetical protein
MNPMTVPAAAPPLWQEARNADGRVYYYNVQTKATQWQKPVELMTPVEVCLPPESRCGHVCANTFLTFTASSSQSAMERIYC